MNRFLLLALTCLVSIASAATNKPGFYTEGRFLKDKNGDKVILRGLNYTAIWMDAQGTKITEMEKTGSNVIRIVWTTGGSSAALDTLISRTIRNNMIPMPELHDLTGKAVTGLATVVDYWTRSDVLKVLLKHQEYLLVNIANEVGPAATDSTTFVNAYASAVQTMRDKGIHVPLIIDADQWGQNIDQLQRCAAPLIAKDPDANLLFSIHLWWPYEYHNTSTGYESPGKRVIGELQESVNKNIPLIIGEFSKISPNCQSTIPYDTIIAEANKHEIGWLAWAWMHGNNDGNGNNCTTMDMTDDGNFNTLHSGWADSVTLSSIYSIKNTAVRPAWIVSGDYTTGTITTLPGEEIVINGTFTTDLASWTQGFWGGSATAAATNGQAVINITAPGTNAWDLQFTQGVAISNGKTYVLKFDAMASTSREMQVLVKNASPYKGYLDKKAALTTAMQAFTFEFTPDEDNAAAELSFQLGAIGTGTITFDNISLTEKSGSGSVLNSRGSLLSALSLHGSSLNVKAPATPWTLIWQDSQGRTVWSKSGTGAEGQMAFALRTLPRGLGMVTLRSGKLTQSLRVMNAQ